MAEDSLDWVRLQKALAVEAETRYSDIVGKQYRFSEFICLSLGKPPKTVNNRDHATPRSARSHSMARFSNKLY